MVAYSFDVLRTVSSCKLLAVAVRYNAASPALILRGCWRRVEHVLRGLRGKAKTAGPCQNSEFSFSRPLSSLCTHIYQNNMRQSIRANFSVLVIGAAQRHVFDVNGR